MDYSCYMRMLVRQILQNRVHRQNISFISFTSGSSTSVNISFIKTPCISIPFSSSSTPSLPLNILSTEEQDIFLKSEQWENIRNFCIIAHIDHGKSTLSDQFLKLTGNISTEDHRTQVLDTLQVEQQRGITVKSQTASMFYQPHSPNKLKKDRNKSLWQQSIDGNGITWYRNRKTKVVQMTKPDDLKEDTTYLLNLIDTPGHVDFSYEVRRSIAACQGALLLVDANQGVQAQTLAVLNMAASITPPLDIIPIVTKIDIASANPNEVALQMEEVFGIDHKDVFFCSAKTGEGIVPILDAITTKIIPPSVQTAMSMRSLLLDSWFDEHRGVICLVSVTEGKLSPNAIIGTYYGETTYLVQEVGILMPERRPTECLSSGQVGYIIANIRHTRDVKLGETFFEVSKDGGRLSRETRNAASVMIRNSKVSPLGTFEPSKPMVYAGLFPDDGIPFVELEQAIEKLTLNDPSVEIFPASSQALGRGFRCGFLGALHMDVFCTRLQQEFDTTVIITSPTVPYIVVHKDGRKERIESPLEFPTGKHIEKYLEPMVIANIICPDDVFGTVNALCLEHRGILEDMEHVSLHGDQILLKYTLPLSEIITKFYDSLKTVSSGYATLDYEEIEPQDAELVLLELLINKSPVDALASIVLRSRAQKVARQSVDKLSHTIDRQNYAIAIQGVIGSKILARQTVKPYRKDVLMKAGKVVGGGDETRKNKLLARQKAGKKRLKNLAEKQYDSNKRLSKKVYVEFLQK